MVLYITEILLPDEFHLFRGDHSADQQYYRYRELENYQHVSEHKAFYILCYRTFKGNRRHESGHKKCGVTA